jgi:hypothetical protein
MVTGQPKVGRERGRELTYDNHCKLIDLKRAYHNSLLCIVVVIHHNPPNPYMIMVVIYDRTVSHCNGYSIRIPV